MSRTNGLDEAGAAALLEASGSAVERSRRRSSALFTGRPLVTWGLAWALGYPGLELVAEPWGYVTFAACIVAASISSWLPNPSGIRSGAEPVVRHGWLIVLIASPFLVGAVGPLPAGGIALLLGGLWGLAMALTGVAMRDRGLVLVAMITVACATLARLAPWGHPLTTYGVAAGLILAAFGSYRIWRTRR